MSDGKFYALVVFGGLSYLLVLTGVYAFFYGAKHLERHPGDACENKPQSS